MSVRKSKFGQRTIFSVESLESRAMLAGNSILPFAHLAHSAAAGGTQSTAAHVSSATAGKSAGAGASLESHGSCHGNNATTTLTGTLTDPNNTAATGTATFSTSTRNGVRTFDVSVTGATANTALDVAIDGTVVGQITTDGNGAGTLSLSSSPTGTQQQLPTNFPTNITTSSVVTVGTLTGTLANSTTTHHSVHQNLSATLTDSTGTATGSARAKVNTESGNSKLTVSVTGAAASTTLDVVIDGTTVGQITTDANGAGRLKLHNASVNVASGSTITVGTLSGTFATSSKGSDDSGSEDSGSNTSSAFSGARAFGRRR